MSPRWRYQILSGGFWGLFMTIFMAFYESRENPLAKQLSEPQFYIRFASFTFIGIFVLGYFNWKAKTKMRNKE